jgi:hypothetical protein
MRHYFSLPRPIPVHPRGVRSPAGKACLVALGGRSLRLPPRATGAVTATVNLAAVATAADDHLAAAGQTQEQPPGDRFIQF